jgi:sugar phosphate isomerase/epimerase
MALAVASHPAFFPRIRSEHLLLGASTGALEAERGDWPNLVELSARLSTRAVELAALSEDELPGLMDHLHRCDQLPFDFISVHGPSKDISSDDDELVEALVSLPSFVDVVVAHPDAMRSPQAFARLRHRLSLENMDARKSDGRTVEELQRCFDVLPEAGFCFDVAHVWSIDPTMGLGHEMLDAFRRRLTHVHVSSLTAQCEHIPLEAEHLDLFAPLLRRCIDVPWIMEAYDPRLD